MADKAISELVAAPSVTSDSLFVLQQDGTAKKLTAQVLENWLLSFADGHGGIQSYELLKTEGLVKTYRFTLADQTPIDIDVVDGRGIESVKPTSTNGLVVTYTMTYNDGTTSTFNVTNGAKGDKGDRADIWVKYASQKPTASSHSFGDVPDTWIGIATGHNMDAAPTDWQQYTWFQWKGEKGDTGEPATLVSSQVTYQVGDSGTIIPSGSWQTSVPSVTPGKFLWTRQVLQFNTGAPITSYSVSRFGIDGAGAVSTVAGVAPDAKGNVPLDASSVKALHIGGGTMEGAINMNGQPISGLNAPTANDQAANMGFVNQKVKKAAPRNLLDNSDFRNPVNQRGVTVSNNGFVVDRWYVFNRTDGTNCTASLTSDGIVTNGSAYLQQRIPKGIVKDGEVYTLAVYFSDGTVDVNNNGEYMISDGFDLVNYITSNGKTIAAVALYEGEYTIDTLPEYQPKGYGTELLECRRYYQELDYNALGNGYTSSGGGAAVLIVNTGIQMRIVPTLVGEKNITVRADGTDYSAQFNNISMYEYGNGAVCEIVVSCTIPANQPAAFFATGKVALSADL